MKIYAHRGARAYAPENTLAAFNKAIRLNADGIELDVHMTRDGEIVVCHDHDISHTSNGQGLIIDQPLAALRRYDFGSWFSPYFKGEKIPTLQEALALLENTRLILNIEIKNSPFPYAGIEQKILDLLACYQMTERVIISSFHHPTLYKLKSLNSRIKTGVLIEGRLLDPLRCVTDVRADYLHPCWIYVDEEVMHAAKACGVGINAYTVNKPEEYALIRRFNVNGIITDYPDRFTGR